MTYRNILLNLDASAECSVRITATLDLASRFDAHVIGLAAIGIPPILYGPEMALSGPLVAQMQDELEQQARRATGQFEAAAKRQGYVRVETRVADFDEVSAMAQSARYADLVVIGQEEPGHTSLEAGRLTPGNMVLASPRPVLVIPYIGAPAGFGKHILIAWNGSREACRAVADALPLLAAAERVTVMAVNPDAGNADHGALPGADLAKYLASHNVKVEAQADPGAAIDVGNELLSRAADLGADLIVMGAYGHSRAREWVFGGVTRTILSGMTMPVLMSH